MVPKNGGRLPKARFSLSEPQLAGLIGQALQSDLGASRRATKTVMAWASVSDHTARAWLNGRTSPSGLHLIVLAAHCHPVLSALLRLTGHATTAINVDIEAIEAGLEELLMMTKNLRQGTAQRATH